MGRALTALPRTRLRTRPRPLGALVRGRESPRTAREFQKRGWTVREKALSVLPAAPVRATPQPQ